MIVSQPVCFLFDTHEREFKIIALKVDEDPERRLVMNESPRMFVERMRSMRSCDTSGLQLPSNRRNVIQDFG